MTTATKYKTYSKYKTSGIDWLGDIPEEWEVHHLKHFVTYTIAGEVIDKNYWVGNGEELTYSCASEPFFTDYKGFEYRRRTTNKDLLLARNGYGVVHIPKEDSIYTNVVQLVRLKEKINREYLYKVLTAQLGYIHDRSMGDIITSINYEIWKQAIVPYPPFEVQKSIVTFLDRKTAKIDEMVEKKQKMMQLLKEKRQALITHAVTKGLDPKAKMKPSGIDWLGDIPEGCEVKKAKYLGRAIIGLTYSPDEVVNENEGVLILRSSNIQNGLIELNDNVYVKKEIPEDLITKIGDILICSRNGSVQLIGKNILIDESTANLSFGAFMTIFRSKYHEFLYYFFNSSLFTSQTGLFSTSTINQLTTSILDNMEIPLPSGEVQKEIVIVLKNKTAKIDAMMKKVETQIEKLQEYRQALITNAVTGKIMVN